MKNCKYILYFGEKVKEFDWEGLVLELLNNPNTYNVKDVSDIVFSKGDVLEQVYTKLLNAKRDYIPELNPNPLLDTDPIYKDSQSISLLEFIDDPSKFLFRGLYNPVTALNRGDFIKSYVEAAKKKNIDPLIATEEANLIVTNWDIICLDSRLLHAIINNFDWFDKPTKTKFTQYVLDNFPKLLNVADLIYAQMYLNKVNMFMTMREPHKLMGKTKIIKGLNLKGHVDMYNEDIVAHYDNIIIDPSGLLHIYDFVVTTEDYDDWDNNKKEKYNYKMALKKQILSLNGYDISNCTVHLIPIKISYNKDFSKLENVAIAVTTYKNLDYSPENRYKFDEYDAVARYFIKSKSLLNTALSEGDLKTILTNINFFLPKSGVTTLLTELTAEEWIARNYNYKMYGKILKSDKEGYAYKVYLDDTYTNPVYIAENNIPTENQKLKLLISENIQNLSGTMSSLLRLLRDKIKTFYKTGNRSVLELDFLGESLSYIIHSILPYLKTFPGGNNSKPSYEWELVENDILDAAGILAFKNLDGQLNFLTLTNLNLKTVTKEGGKTTILLLYIPDEESGELIRFKNNYANILAIRTMLIINEALPKLTKSLEKLGKITILSTDNIGESENYSIEKLANNILPKMYEIIQKYEPQYTFKNNFLEFNKYINPLLLLKLEYKNINADLNIGELELLKGLHFEIFKSEDSKEIIRKKLLDFIAVLEEKISKEGRENINLSPESIIREARARNNTITKAYCSLYLLALLALSYYSGFTILNEKFLNAIDEYSYKMNRHPNATFRLCANLYARAIDDIADQTASDVYDILSVIRLFYRDSGYTSIQNDIIGNEAAVYDNLYAAPMLLKNPYKHDANNQLKDYERKFLKRILFEFAKIKVANNPNIDFNFTSENDPDLPLFIESNPWYLNVPLELASKATLRYNLLKGKSDITKSISDKYHKSKEFLKLLGRKELVTPDNTKDIYLLSLRSKFAGTEGFKGSTIRMKKLAENPDDFWETNLENVLIDYIEDHNRVKILNLTFIEMKSILLELLLLKESVNKVTGIELTLKLIHEYIKLNFFEESLLSPTNKKIEKWINPFRKLVSRAFIAGNLVSAMRDITEGLLLNTMRTINHFGTDLTTKNVSKAYGYVTTHMWQDCMSINKIDLLCKIYRLSNMDISRISEGLKTNRGGILNYENWLYATLRKPDFLNRMVLFVARCMLDGCWEAFELENGLLKYNPLKDERYKIYLLGNTNDPRYLSQRDAYYNAILTYNKEHGTDYVPNSSTLLPTAYSNLQIQTFRELANNIYGAYDRSMRAGYENIFLGIMCGSFTTWMNGIWANVAAHPDIYADSPIEQVEEKINGHLVYLDGNLNDVLEIVDDNGNKSYVYADTNLPYQQSVELLGKKFKNVPNIVLGTYFTIKHLFNALKRGYDNPNSTMWELFQSEIWDNALELLNLNKVISDFLAAFIIALLFKLVITPGYKDFKKHTKEHSALEDTLGYLMYSSTSRAYDGFLGPVNVFLQLGENLNPPFYELPIKIATDMSKVVFGDKTVMSMLTSDVALFKNALGFYKNYIANNN